MKAEQCNAVKDTLHKKVKDCSKKEIRDWARRLDLINIARQLQGINDTQDVDQRFIHFMRVVQQDLFTGKYAKKYAHETVRQYLELVIKECYEGSKIEKMQTKLKGTGVK